MDRGIAELVRNLGEIQPLTADELFGRIDLHAGKIVDDPTAAPLTEQLLHLGAADQVVTADLLDGKLTGQVVFQIGKEPFVNIPVRSAPVTDGRFLLTDEPDEELFQIKLDHLKASEGSVSGKFHLFLSNQISSQ